MRMPARISKCVRRSPVPPWLVAAITFPANGNLDLDQRGVTIADANDPNTLITVTGLDIGVNIFQWEVYNGGCTNQLTSDQVDIVLFDAPAPAADAGADQEFCAPDYSTTSPGTRRWVLRSAHGPACKELVRWWTRTRR